jgi:hypothetical protein
MREGLRAATLLAALLGAAPAAAGPALDRIVSVEHASLPGYRLAIRVRFERPPARAPEIFRSFHPSTYIVLRFEQTATALGRGAIEIGRGDVRSIEIVPSESRVQLVLQLAAPLVLQTAIEGAELHLTLQRPPARDADRSSAWPFGGR